MTAAGVKQYLKSYMAAVSAAGRVHDDIEDLRTYTDEPDIQDKLGRLKNQMTALEDERINLYTKIYREIEQLPDEQERMILSYRYIRGYTWEYISRCTGYCLTQVHRIHNKALNSFKESRENNG